MIFDFIIYKIIEEGRIPDNESQTLVESKIGNEEEDKPKNHFINVLITISGWNTTVDNNDFFLPWSVLPESVYGDHYCLQWESKELKELGNAINIIASEVYIYIL